MHDSVNQLGVKEAEARIPQTCVQQPLDACVPFVSAMVQKTFQGSTIDRCCRSLLARQCISICIWPL